MGPTMEIIVLEKFSVINDPELGEMETFLLRAMDDKLIGKEREALESFMAK